MRVEGSWLGVSGFRLGFQGSEFRAWGSGSGVRVYGLGCRPPRVYGVGCTSMAASCVLAPSTACLSVVSSASSLLRWRAIHLCRVSCTHRQANLIQIDRQIFCFVVQTPQCQDRRCRMYQAWQRAASWPPQPHASASFPPPARLAAAAIVHQKKNVSFMPLLFTNINKNVSFMRFQA